MKSCSKVFFRPALMCVVLAFAQLASSAFADSKGDTVLSYTCGTRIDAPIFSDVRYSRIIRLQHNGSANGTLIATFDDWPNYFPIYKSLDDGVTWKQISWPTLLTTNWQVRVEPSLFELPTAAGDLPAGTIMLAGNSYNRTNNNSHRMEIWCSTNQGVNWQFRGVADTSTNQGLWEPCLGMSSAGQLVCYYSDERFQTNGYSQLIGERVSPDGGLTWGPETYVVAVPDGTKRPGMAVTTKLPNGQYVLSYEGVKYGGWSQVYLKFSSDGTNWGSPTDVGTPVQTASGAYPGAVPYITWCPAGGSKGTLVISSGFSINTPNTDRELYINTNLGQGYWTMIPAPVQWQGGSSFAGYSQGLLPTADGQGVIHMASSQITINGNTNLNEMLVGREQLILPGKTYTIVNQNSGLALEIPGNSATPGVGLQQGVPDNSAAQQWTFNDLGNNVWMVVNRKNQLAWDDTGSNTNAGTTLEQSNSNGLAAQQFKLRPVGNGCWNFINVNSGLSVVVTNASTSAGAPIVLWTTATNTDQNWFLSQTNPNAPTAPVAPSGLSATGGNLVVNLHWTQSTSPGITGNNVYRSTAASGVPYTLIAKLGATTSYSDAAVAAGTTYYYHVTAVNANGESSLSAKASATTAAAVLSTAEEFAYPTGTENLSGQNGGRGFGSAWNTAGSVVSPGLSYSSLVVASNAVSLSNENAFRALTSNYDVTNMGTVWISMLMQRTDTGTQWGGLSLFSGNATEKFFMGATGGHYGFTSYATPGVMQYIGPASSQGVTTFLVCELQSNGTSVTIKFYANPGLGSAPPPTPTGMAVTGDFSFNTIRLGTGGNFKFDEVRLGTSWANVVPISSMTPASPTGLSAAGGNSGVHLNWTQSTSPNITSNNVYRSATGSGGPYNLLASLPATTSYSDTAVNAGSTYYYSVAAVNANGESTLSANASATTVPLAPTGLTATAASSSQIDLSWTQSLGAASYTVKRATTSGGPYTPVATGVTATSFSDTGLSASVTYYYVVSAVNSGGESADSTQVSAVPPAANAYDVAADSVYAGHGSPNGLGEPGGENGGFGFGHWTFTVGGTGGAFIQSSGPSGDSFDLWNASADSSTVAVRPFDSPLAVGQSFTVYTRLNYLDAASNTNELALEDSSGNILFGYWHYGSEANNGVNGEYSDATTNDGAAVNFQYAYQQFQSFTFTLNSPTTYTFTDNSTGASFAGSISNSPIAQVAFIRFNGAHAPSNGQDFQFDQLQITSSSSPSFSVTPAQGALSVPATDSISAQVAAGSVPLNLGAVSLTVDGSSVTPTVGGSSSLMTVSYTPSAALGAGTQHTVQLVVRDNDADAYTNIWSFTTGFASLPAVLPGPFTVSNSMDLTIFTAAGDPWLAGNYLSTSNQTLYARFSMEFDNTNDTSSIYTWGGMDFFQGSNEKLLFGKNGGSPNWSMAIDGANGPDFNPAVTVVTNDWHTIVVRIDYQNGAAANETVWLDPDFTKTEANQPQAPITLSDDNTFDNIRLRAGFNDASATYSNIIITATSAGVGFAAGVPPGVLSIQNGRLLWTGGGTLQSAPAITGPWSTFRETNGQTIYMTNSAQFFRLRQ